MAYLLGHLKHSNPDHKALLKLEKAAFEDAMLSTFNASESILSSLLISTAETTHNFTLELSSTFSTVICEFIYPAPPYLLANNTHQSKHLIKETQDMYEAIAKPLYIDKKPVQEIEWIYNILQCKKEIELTVFRNELFTLQLDFMYNHKDLETLYLLAIPIQRDLTCIRDLRGKHIPLLKSIKSNSYAAIQSRFNLPPSQIIAVFNYHPTYYHLHIHFAHVNMSERMGLEIGRGIGLTDAIENLKLDGAYYLKKSLSVGLGEGHELHRVYKENGVI
ncbi:hypothetical protein FGO68_gene13907 [Halteria grandinella]|uniref:M7GpppX diphosphatase n=1 Tax=Halteria grandinella TaxID=5974 RepID=A0A8J8NJN4_HALGN|nr:hypothetical protein FGO68_gene13907 [Halteria grandinella]